MVLIISHYYYFVDILYIHYQHLKLTIYIIFYRIVPLIYSFNELGLNTAIQLLGLPRKLGFHPETNKTVSAGIGMYGPYVLHDKKYKALEKTDDILEVDLNRAIELLAKAYRL